MLHIPITGAVLISAWDNRTKKIKTEALVPSEISCGYFEHNCIIAPGVIADCILGAKFLAKFQVNISFGDQCMYTKDENGRRRHQFVNEEMSKDESKEEAPVREISNSTIDVDKREPSCNNERNLGVLASDIAYDNPSFLLGDDDDSIEKSRCCLQHTTVCADPSMVAMDTRAIQDSEILRTVEEASSLSTEQKIKLFDVLSRYKKFFTSIPGRCRLFQYEFKVTPGEPLVGHNRPIPFAVGSTVRAQIKQMLEDKTIEPSDSSYLNTLTIVLREGKSPRMCLNARRVNWWTSSDRARVAPINERQQQFHGSRFITNIDLSSALLQIPLEHESRKFTAFHREGKIYQFICTPYGFCNSLAQR
jgi:hypothetical protein